MHEPGIDLVDQLFVLTNRKGPRFAVGPQGQFSIKEDVPIYALNESFEVKLSGIQEQAQFLAAAIRYWNGKSGIFCHNHTQAWNGSVLEPLPEDQWEFDYKTPSTCGGCETAQKILDKIFDDRRKFNTLPIVRMIGDRAYGFRFSDLLYLAENGQEATELWLWKTGRKGLVWGRS